MAKSSRWTLFNIVELQRNTGIVRVKWLGPRTCKFEMNEHFNIGNPLSKLKDRIAAKTLAKEATLSSLIRLFGTHPPELPIRAVEIALASPRAHLWDGDNEVIRAKHYRDAVAFWLGCDDKEGKGVDAWVVKAVRSKETTVSITITPESAPREY